jgi:hypothetical protein
MTRKKDLAGADVKAGIMGVALSLQGLWEFFEHVEDGDDYVSAAGKAVKTHRMRKEALTRATHEVVTRARKEPGKP